MIRDVLNMARFHFPNNVNSLSKEHLSNYIETYFKERVSEKSSENEEGSQYCIDTSSYSFNLSEEEKKKHEFYENVHHVFAVPNGASWTVENQFTEIPVDTIREKNIFDDLTRDDLQRLIETEDELSQSLG